MSNAVILQHVPHEGPGRIVPVFRDFGIPTQVRHLYKGDEVPTDLDEVRVLIVLGGPMSVADAGSGKFPFLSQEIELLKRMVQLDRPVLGICLGAQLLAHAAGAKVYPNVKMAPPAAPGQPPQPAEPLTPLPEIGWAPVTFPFPGGTEPIVFGCVDGMQVFHWHYDTFDIPKLPPPPNAPPPPAPPPPTGSALLSSSKLCKNQAFRFKTKLFGFQYHLEMTPDGIDAMLQHGAEGVQQVLGPEGVALVREETKKHYPRYERLGDRVLGNFVQFLKVY
ncbi:MAG TPA: gamma-glutamyl-gamma-aminobutyrate hydrolase family protein [Tepidisphaeraceae bacterium]|nr:gamma-glutamyl-gamma-aminobutyrate hydrolase family protein [Tepidisphaeraceae bacterium]